MKMIAFFRYRICIVAGFLCVAGFGFSATPAYAGINFMTDSGQQIGTLDVSDTAQNKGKVVVTGADGKEVTLGGGGSCGTLCAILTAKIENGKAFLAPAVPDVELGSSALRFKTIFTEMINAKEYELLMSTPELATAAVGKMVGIVSANGANAKIGLVDTKDERVDVLITEMNQAKMDIVFLKAQLAIVQKELSMKVKEEVDSCRSESIPVQVDKVVGSGDWIVTPLIIAPPKMPRIPMPGMPPVMQIPPLIQV